ncbi:YciI family protein [Devosia sp.]|uniref:YciI family protein n=1 Tax=Devosia sp. TaxID=1871048 RepID=UPI003A8F534B
MPQFLVAIQHPVDYDGSAEPPEMGEEISALNREMTEAGIRLFAGGLQPGTRAKSVRRGPNGALSVTDGPYAETREMIGGFWILEVADMDAALGWAKKAAVACRVPVEVRAFH